jgi:hypothetical protein
MVDQKLMDMRDKAADEIRRRMLAGTLSSAELDGIPRGLLDGLFGSGAEQPRGSAARTGDAAATAAPAPAPSDTPACYVCLEGSDPEYGEIAHGGCGCRGSAGWAHLSCLVKAAEMNDMGICHTSDMRWRQCPTCKQAYTGELIIGLSRARWEPVCGRPEADEERLNALSNLGKALGSSVDHLPEARQKFEELVAVRRRVHGDENLDTLDAIGNLGVMVMGSGDLAAAQPLLEEARDGLRRAGQGEHHQTLLYTRSLAAMHSSMGAVAKARLLHEEVVGVLRRTEHAKPTTFMAIGDLGEVVARIGDHKAGLALREEAVSASARRELGDVHVITQHAVRKLAEMRQNLARHPPGTRAIGSLVGLASRPELNGKDAWVIGFDEAKGRYRVRPGDTCLEDKLSAIKPANLILNQGTAVIVGGLEAAPEWNGERGLVERYDKVAGRYQLLMKGREKALGVKAERCTLDFSEGGDEKRESEATRRARVEATVRAAIAAREPELEPELESQGPH